MTVMFSGYLSFRVSTDSRLEADLPLSAEHRQSAGALAADHGRAPPGGVAGRRQRSVRRPQTPQQSACQEQRDVIEATDHSGK